MPDQSDYGILLLYQKQKDLPKKSKDLHVHFIYLIWKYGINKPRLMLTAPDCADSTKRAYLK